MKQKLRKTKSVVAGLLLLCSLFLLVVSFAGAPLVKAAAASPQASRGQGAIHRDDPCAEIPADLPNARHLVDICHSKSSSSGVVKGDFNGDGFADLAIGEPDATLGGETGAGDVFVIYGSANGLTSTGVQVWELDKFCGPTCPTSGDHFGAALASGDFNGDGYSDLAIGIPGKHDATDNPTGEVLVLYGSPAGLQTGGGGFLAPLFVSAGDVLDCSNSLDCYGAGFGQSLAWGDFNGDGFGDLAIGAPNVGIVFSCFYGYATCESPVQGGAVAVLRGSSGGLKRSFATVLLDPTTDDYAHFGQAMTAGDFNGNGYTDLVVAAPGQVVGQAANAGALYVFNGSSGGIANGASPSQIWFENSPGLILGGAGSGDQFSAALAAGDFNGDGKSDLAIGIPGKTVGANAKTGVVSVLYGSSTGLTAAGNQAWDQNALGLSDQSGARFGSALAAGDFNGDGRADLAIGVPFKTVSGFANAGEVNVAYGSSSGLSTTAGRGVQVFRDASPETGERFGSALTAWNFGRNEIETISTPFGTIRVLRQTADLAIGAPYRTVGVVSGAGAVNVFYGSYLTFSNGLVPSSRQVITAPTLGFGALAGAHFGAALY